MVGSKTDSPDPGFATFQLNRNAAAAFRRSHLLDEHTVVFRKHRGVSDLAVQASRNTDNVVPGGEVTYTATVTNPGP